MQYTDWRIYGEADPNRPEMPYKTKYGLWDAKTGDWLARVWDIKDYWETTTIRLGNASVTSNRGAFDVAYEKFDTEEQAKARAMESLHAQGYVGKVP